MERHPVVVFKPYPFKLKTEDMYSIWPNKEYPHDTNEPTPRFL
jgi:hypothetical protein